MKFLVVMALVINLFANDILTSYRLNGIANIEKELDLELIKEEYWSKIVEQSDTKFGFIESYKNILACDKSLSSLEFFSKDEHNKFNFIKKHSAYLGKANGDKLKAGDLKTPIGVYRLIQKLSKDTKLDPFYGPYAFVTSYPNIYDTYQGKSGSGIWIHGLPDSSSRDEFTKGCIAISNQSMECLNKNLDLDKTLLIINDSKVAQDLSKNIYTTILSQLYAWRYAWRYDEIDNYLSFYANDFIRDDGMNFEQFKSYKSRVFSKNERKSIIFTDINIVPYPSSKNMYYISFREDYRSDSFKFNGEKILIIRLDENKMKIITEK